MLIDLDETIQYWNGGGETVFGYKASEIVGQLERAEEVLQKFEDLDPDLVVMDISLPGMSGLELVKHLTSRDPDLKILAVSRHEESLYAERVIRAGAKGYVMKMEASDVLLKAVKKILNGGGLCQ